MLRILRTALGACALMVTAVTMSSATPPGAPTQITGTVGSGSSGPHITVVWSWSPNTPDSLTQHDGSRLYLGIALNGAIQFRMLADVQDSVGLPGIAYYNMPVNTAGRYYFYATGYNADGEGSASDTIYVDYPTSPRVHFSAQQFFDSATVGVPFSRYFTAQGPAGQSIRYSLVNNSGNNVYYDPVTGRFQWTPGATGTYTFGLVATIVEDTTNVAYATLVLAVNGLDTSWSVRFIPAGSRTLTLAAGQIFRDSVFAETRDGTPVWYALENAPAGMTIDSTSGVIDWTAVFNPTNQGYYSFRVVAGRIGEAQSSASIGYVIRVQDTIIHAHLMGYVTDSLRQYFVNATIYLYRQVGQLGAITYQLYDSMSAAQGYFSFRDIPGGNYIVHAIPSIDTTFAPGYYVRDGMASMTWQGATVVALGQNNTLGDSIQIRLSRTNGRGTNRLDGTIVGNGGSIRIGGAPHVDGLVPVAGAVVYAVDANSLIADYDVTDASGTYGLDNLGSGTFTIVVDRVGFGSTTRTVTFVTDDGGEEGVDIEIESVGGSSGVPIDPRLAASLLISPNPSTTSVRISFEGRGSLMTLRLMDELGQMVYAQTMTGTTGRNVVDLPLNGVHPGTYIVAVSGPSGVATARAVVVR